MPVPQKLNFLVGRASCPSYYILKNRQDACSTKTEFSCGAGILPASERLINNNGITPII